MTGEERAKERDETSSKNSHEQKYSKKYFHSSIIKVLAIPR